MWRARRTFQSQFGLAQCRKARQASGGKMKKRLVSMAVALVGGAFACSPGVDPGSRVVAEAEMQALSADNAQFAATDLTSPRDPTGRQTISVSFFVGHIGPVANGSAHCTHDT